VSERVREHKGGGERKKERERESGERKKDRSTDFFNVVSGEIEAREGAIDFESLSKFPSTDIIDLVSRYLERLPIPPRHTVHTPAEKLPARKQAKQAKHAGSEAHSQNARQAGSEVALTLHMDPLLVIWQFRFCGGMASKGAWRGVWTRVHG